MPRPELHPRTGASPVRTAAPTRPAVTRPAAPRTGGPVGDLFGVLLQRQRRLGNHHVQHLLGGRVPDGPAPGATAAGAPAPGVAAALHRRGGGRPLDPVVGDEVGRELGADLQRVRVHADATADGACRSLGAAAFTVGRDVFFAAHRYRPRSTEGRRLVAHELAHVVQQDGAGPPPAGIPHVGPADDAHERQADRVADHVTTGTGGRPGNAVDSVPLPVGGPVIQRQVYVGSTWHTRLRNWDGPDPGQGGRSVPAMIADDPRRYFRDKRELCAYAAHQTDTVGHLDTTHKAKKVRAWIRLGPELLVLGENHSQITTDDVVRAVETSRFMYEPYTAPPWTTEGSRVAREMAEAFEERDADLPIGHRPPVSHLAESFWPKVLRGLYEVEPGQTPPGSPMWRLLRWAILASSRTDAAPEGVRQAYLAHQATLDEFLAADPPDPAGWVQEVGAAAAGAGVAALHDAIGDHVRAAFATDPLVEGFEKRWSKATQDYDDVGRPAVLAADRTRDLSMYGHILRAQQEGYLLYGLGKIHGERLGRLLRKHGIKYSTVDDFVAKQEKRHPQK